MPISKSEWDAGITPEAMEARILKCLQDNRDKAYTAEELGQALGEFTKTSSVNDFESLRNEMKNRLHSFEISGELEILVRQGKVQKRSINTKRGLETHYMAV